MSNFILALFLYLLLDIGLEAELQTSEHILVALLIIVSALIDGTRAVHWLEDNESKGVSGDADLE